MPRLLLLLYRTQENLQGFTHLQRFLFPGLPPYQIFLLPMVSERPVLSYKAEPLKLHYWRVVYPKKK